MCGHFRKRDDCPRAGLGEYTRSPLPFVGDGLIPTPYTLAVPLSQSSAFVPTYRRSWGVALRTLGLLLALALGASGRELTFQRAAPGTQLSDLAKAAGPTLARDELVDAGDSYLVPGRGAVRLLRSKSQVAVRLADGQSRAAGLAELKAARGVAPHEAKERASFRQRGSVEILRGSDRARGLDAAAVRRERSVRYAYPVLYDPKSKLRLAPTDEVLARFAPDLKPADIAALARAVGLDVLDRTGAAELGSYRLRLRDAKSSDPLAVARALGAQPGVRWAQPNFIREFRPSLTPDAPLFPQQQSLNNTGQNGAVADADVDAPEAWKATTGSNGVVIAILDDGVDIAHPALRIFTNPAEIAGDGIDNDSNGLVDDVHGWDFADADNAPSPVGTNGHGTACAGIAAATFSAQSKAVGIAPGCTILPVKIADDTGVFTTDEIIGNAIAYAAAHADILSNSWGGGSDSAFINDAIDYAAVQGRGGKGCPVFFASGNGASTWYEGGGRYRLSTQGLNGDYYFSFALVKGATAAGEDKVRIDNVCLLGADGYTHLTSTLGDQDFEFWNPTLGSWWLFSSTGAGSWSLDSTNALTGTGGLFSAVSPTLTEGQIAWLFTPKFRVTGDETLAFAASVSISTDTELYIAVYEENATTGNLDFVGAYGPINGVPEPDPAVTYPASQPNAIAVGASTDCDLRADFSQWQGKLDFVAPSNGGWNDITALDPLGAIGWTAGDTKPNFGGTSAATPLTAGIAALMLSQKPSLTAMEIRTLMRQTCDQIGFATYIDGVAPEYGYGRVNAARAVAAALPTIQIAETTVAELASSGPSTATLTFTLSAPTTRDVTFHYATAADTALAGTNFTATSGDVTFPAGTTTQTVSIGLLNASFTVPNLVFRVDLSAPTEATLGRAQATVLITAPDTDHDGMADWWETANGFAPNDAADGPLDRDGDGQSNAAEFFAATDPSDPTSALRLISEKIETGLRLRFPSVLGRVYRIETSASLVTPLWSEVAELPGTGSEIEVDAATSGNAGFFRVRVVR